MARTTAIDNALSTRSVATRRHRSSPRRRMRSRRSTSETFDEFWERNGRERVTWFEPFTQLYEWELPYAKWYLGGKLNVAFNCVDRHVEAGLGDRVAYLLGGRARRDDRRAITYAELQRDVVRIANALKELGVGKGTAGRDLHGDGAGARVGDARVHAPRRAAHGRVRRLLGRLALRPDERHGVRGARDPGRGVAAREAGAVEATSPTRRWRRRPACATASSCGARARRCR